MSRTDAELYVNEPEHFDEWWDTQIASGVDSRCETTARAAWNKSLDLAAEEVGLQEGTSFGVKLTFRA